MKFKLFVAGISAFIASGAAQARPPSDQDMARAAAQRGTVMPLPRILGDLRRSGPFSRMDYLGGVAFDPSKLVYRLKYLDGNRVVFVYVDARNGHVIGRTN